MDGARGFGAIRTLYEPKVIAHVKSSPSEISSTRRRGGRPGDLARVSDWTAYVVEYDIAREAARFAYDLSNLQWGPMAHLGRKAVTKYTPAQ